MRFMIKRYTNRPSFTLLYFDAAARNDGADEPSTSE